MKNVSITILCISLFSILNGSCSQQSQVITFEESKTVPGTKIALSTFDADFPRDWTAYNYLVLKMKCSTAQRVYVGLTTETGYNELRLIFYGIGGWIRTAIPLEYFSQPAAGAHDLAATYNHKRPLSYINLDRGTRRPLVGVDSIGFRMHCPVGGDQTIEIEDIYLTVDDPGDAYLEDKPVVDRFGQWNLGEFEGKVHSLEELKADWAEEDQAIADMKAGKARFSKYGGDLNHKSSATGFFRVEKIDGKWWFVDPDGYLFLSLGSNCVRANNSSNYIPPKGAYTLMPPDGFDPDYLGIEMRKGVAEGPTAIDKPALTGFWNLYRRYGAENITEKALQKIADRMTLWGMNTVGAWSTDRLRKPHTAFITAGRRNNIYGLVDIYEPGFKDSVEKSIMNSVKEKVNDDMLLGYFIGNEPSFSNQEDRLAELILEASDDVPMKKAYLDYIKKHGQSTESNKAFAYKTFSEYIKIVCDATRKYDPNHLILGIRFGRGVPEKDVLQLSKDYFDVYSFNNYGMDPLGGKKGDTQQNIFDAVYQATGLPMIIGEYHFGTTDRALGESLVRVNSQQERGIAYRNYSEAAFSHPACIGLSWFQWNDQEMFGRRDGENYNIGLIDITDRPYPHMVDAIKAVSTNMYEIHHNLRQPFYKQLYRYGGDFPDIWE